MLTPHSLHFSGAANMPIPEPLDEFLYQFVHSSLYILLI